jgi:hypothetical protein
MPIKRDKSGKFASSGGPKGSGGAPKRAGKVSNRASGAVKAQKQARVEGAKAPRALKGATGLAKAKQGTDSIKGFQSWVGDTPAAKKLARRTTKKR